MLSLLARLTLLYTEMLTNRELVNFQKWDFFDFLYTFTINCVTTDPRKCLLSRICFALFGANKAKKSCRRAKSVAC